MNKYIESQVALAFVMLEKKRKDKDTEHEMGQGLRGAGRRIFFVATLKGAGKPPTSKPQQT